MFSLIRSLIFIVSFEKYKESVAGRHRRAKSIYKPYIAAGIPLKLILYWISKAPGSWFLLSLTARIAYNQNSYLEFLNDDCLLSDHTSGCFKRHYDGDVTKPVTFVYKLPRRTVKFRLIFSAFLLGYKIVRRLDNANPEIVARFFASYIHFHYLLTLEAQIKTVVVSDDLMPNDLALLLAAQELGLKTSVFRVNDATKRVCPPFRISLLYCMSVSQLEESGRYQTKTIVAKQALPLCLEKIKHADQFLIGIPLTSKYCLVTIAGVLDKIRSPFPVRFIVKAHPETDTGRIISEIKEVQEKYTLDLDLFEPERSLKEFASSIDFSIAGNSSAAKDLYDMGVPILYRNDLDFGEFDAHGWFRSGIFYDFRSKVILDPTDVAQFYEKN